MFVEPTREDLDDVYADNETEGLEMLRQMYEGDVLKVLEPLRAAGEAQGLQVASATPAIRDAVAERLVDLAEGASWTGVTHLELVPRACAAAQRFLEAEPWRSPRAQGVLTARVSGALNGEADIVVNSEPQGVPSFTLHWRPIPMNDGKTSLDVLVLSFNPMPSWVAPGMRAVYGHAFAPAPAKFERGLRVLPSNLDVMLLVASCEVVAAWSRGTTSATAGLSVGDLRVEASLTELGPVSK
jgi:hypothetical protein